ncbi:zinc ribbon domain-containing protein [Calycomorphotria hydatis]|uniref:Uncharacterized protein n=1 Tax=Calycomorphotria hydatis TaxID=2528027 RepID=A0A517T4B5_9PLAN|nr:hypothetical protein [Calycomorphotria hydatis]QDT63212.1 hypothetical protein V22_04300 [Calycomorphotria hydatis]
MAIEFDCPHCKATIRVPDEASGKQGTCPGCRQKLRVPQLESIGEPAAEVPPAAVPEIQINVSAEEERPGTSRRRRRKRGKSSGGGLWINIGSGIACGALVVGVIVYLMTADARRLQGTIAATVDQRTSLPAKEINLPASGIPEELRDEVMSQLSAPGLQFASSLMMTKIQSSKNDLVVSIETSSRTKFFRVPLGQEEIVKGYLGLQRETIARLKRKEQHAAIEQLFADFGTAISNGASPTDLSRFRDTVAISGLVGVLGYSIEANVSGHAYPCVYEEDNGTVYFALPAETGQFQILGRRLSDGSIPLPLNYSAKISGVITVEE